MLILRIALLAFISLLLVIVGVLSLGHQLPDDPLLLDFHRCEDRICAFTIAPDITTFTEGETILQANPRLRPSSISSSSAYSVVPPFYRIDLYSGGDEKKSVTEINLYFRSKRLITANQILAKFGPPCAMIPRYIPTELILIYPGMVAFFEDRPPPNVGRLTPSARLIQLNLFDNDVYSCSQLEFTTARVPWRGFRKY